MTVYAGTILRKQRNLLTLVNPADTAALLPVTVMTNVSVYRVQARCRDVQALRNPTNVITRCERD